jgi:hypothetical protein
MFLCHGVGSGLAIALTLLDFIGLNIIVTPASVLLADRFFFFLVLHMICCPSAVHPGLVEEEI